MLQCPMCFGQLKVQCIQCNGKGTVGHGSQPMMCVLCGGTGRMTCPTCHGMGVVAPPPPSKEDILLGQWIFEGGVGFTIARAAAGYTITFGKGRPDLPIELSVTGNNVVFRFRDNTIESQFTGHLNGQQITGEIIHQQRTTVTYRKA